MIVLISWLVLAALKGQESVVVHDSRVPLPKIVCRND